MKTLSLGSSIVRFFTLVVFGLAVISVPAESRTLAISTHFTSLNLGERAAGTGATLGYNLSRRFSLESSLNLFTGDTRNHLGASSIPVLGSWRSGNILQGQFGLSAKVVRVKRAELFVKAKPGFTSFGHLAYHAPSPLSAPNSPEQILADGGRQTCFSFDVGGGTVFLTGRNTFVRFEMGDTIVRYNAFTTTFNSGTGILPIIRIPQATAHTLQFSIGIGLRFGQSK